MGMVRSIQYRAGAVVGVALIRERRLRQRAERFAAAALESLLGAVDANDSQTGAHVRRVADYALVLADTLGVSDDERRTIELTALFHDIGKIHEALFDIVHEPRRLTPAERREIHTHPIRGAEVLAPIAHFHPALAEAVLSHHEQWDGRGYPRGLKGRRIPLAARVVAIADTFDAVAHRRRYRDGRSAQEASDVILAGRGTQFDPNLVDLILLPPVFQQFVSAQRDSLQNGELPRTRRESKGYEQAPHVEVRWRSRSAPPTRVRDKIAQAR